MPYRRLPNTDVSRLRALKIAEEKGKELPPFKLAYNQATFNKLISFLPQFEKAFIETRKAYQFQVEKNKEYLNILKKARMYISHFIQVFNMAIQRGELSASERLYFNLNENDNKVPDLNSEDDVLKWGEIIINGEYKRMQDRKALITNPTIAVVKVRYEKFKEAYYYQKTLQKNFKRLHENLESLRKEADKLIATIWDEVEEHYKNLPPDEKRNKCAEYGIVYVYRKEELKKLKFVPQQ